MIPINRQADLLSINRSSVYRDPPKAKSISEEDLFIMRRIDELHTAHPTWGYRTISRIIRGDDQILVNRKKVRRMMRHLRENLCPSVSETGTEYLPKIT